MAARATCGVYEAMWLARLHSVSAHALYLHVPFCAQKCAYCDFASWQTPRGDACMGRYVDALCEQIGHASRLGLLAQCRTAYVGGGTPTLLGAEALGRLVSCVRGNAPRLTELTVEANPDSLDDEVLRALVDSGATRLSIGVQSLCDDELRALGRLHDAELALHRVRAAVASGLDVSVDLMCATPGQTDVSWERTLRQIVDLGVGHVSVYPLQIEEGTPLAHRVGDEDPAWNDSQVQAARMEQAERVLSAAGFSRYEVASYALPGKQCAHNQAYWTGLPYLGLGAGASSMLTREGYDVLRSCAPWLPETAQDEQRMRLTTEATAAVAHGEAPLDEARASLEFLTGPQAAAEDLMLGMRMASGVNPGLLEHARHVLGEKRVDSVVDECVERGLASWQEGRLAPTHDGWLLGNELYGALWDLAPGDVRTSTR